MKVFPSITSGTREEKRKIQLRMMPEAVPQGWAGSCAHLWWLSASPPRRASWPGCCRRWRGCGCLCPPARRSGLWCPSPRPPSPAPGAQESLQGMATRHSFWWNPAAAWQSLPAAWIFLLPFFFLFFFSSSVWNKNTCNYGFTFTTLYSDNFSPKYSQGQNRWLDFGFFTKNLCSAHPSVFPMSFPLVLNVLFNLQIHPCSLEIFYLQLLYCKRHWNNFSAPHAAIQSEKLPVAFWKILILGISWQKCWVLSHLHQQMG